MAEIQRPILEHITDMVKGNVVPDSETLQALKNAFPLLADDLDNMDKLTPEYIKGVLIPAIKVLKQDDLIKLHQSLKTKSELKSLVQEIHDATVYIPKDGNALPGVQSSSDRIKSPLKSGYKSMESFLKSLVGIDGEKQQEETLMAEIIASADRSVAKFDQYVLRGDGKQYGDKANDWLEIDSWNTDIRRPTNDKKIRHNVENVSKASFVEVINDVVKIAKDPANTIDINGSSQKVGNGTRVEKLAYLASWMSALEEGCDTALPGLVAEAANKTAKVAIDSTVGVAADFAGGIWDEYPKMVIFTASVIGYAAYRTGGLLKGIVNAPGATVKLVGKAASFVPVVNKLAPYIEKLGTGMSVFGDRLTTTNGATGAAATGSPGATPEGPKTPRRFVEVNPADLEKFKPGEDNYKEYRQKTIDAIKASGGAAPAAGTPPSPQFSEATTRHSKFLALDAEYSSGKISLGEYLKRTEDIMKGYGKIVVKDVNGKIDWSRTWRNVVQRTADRTPVVSSLVSRNMPNGSATGSVNGIQAAKNRIKGTSYEAIDYDGNPVKFENMQAKALYEEFRDKLERYTQMQEWDATNRDIIAKEQLRNTITGTDIPAKQLEITAKSAVIGATPATISGPPIVVAGVATPTQVANPLLVTLNEDLRQLQSDLSRLNAQVSTLNGEIATLRGKPHAYVPNAGTRTNFHQDIRTLKLELSNTTITGVGATGLIQKINHHADPSGVTKAIPDTAFDPKALKINKVNLLIMVAKALT